MDTPDNAVPLLRAANTTDGEIDLADFVYVDRSKLGGAADSFIQEGDVLVTRTGANAGATSRVPALPREYIVSSHSLRLIPNTDEVDSRYLEAFLLSRWGKAQLVRSMTGAAQKQLQIAGIGPILIARPPREVQTRLVAALDAARAARRRKLEEAESLLGGLDAFVLETLGLTLPPLDGRSVYAVRLRDARRRFDPDYNSPRFRALRSKIERGKYPSDSVGRLFDPIVSGFAAGGDDQTDDPSVGVPHIRPLNISNAAELHFEGTKMVPRSAVEPGDFLKQGEVLFNNTNSTAWVGKTVVFDVDRECACSNHITRLTLIDKGHSAYYFAALFNALRGLGYFGLLSTNFNNQAGVNVDTLRAVRLPVPDSPTQKKIAAEVSRRREAARRLRDEARAGWDDAKRRFEEELLGPAT